MPNEDRDCNYLHDLFFWVESASEDCTYNRNDNVYKMTNCLLLVLWLQQVQALLDPGGSKLALHLANNPSKQHWAQQWPMDVSRVRHP